jgi:hypothetical protein
MQMKVERIQMTGRITTLDMLIERSRWKKLCDVKKWSIVEIVLQKMHFVLQYFIIFVLCVLIRRSLHIELLR